MKFKKLISSSLAIGLIFNSTSVSLASVLSEDVRYETFEGSNITIDNILEEDKVDVEIEGNTMVNYAQNGSKELTLNGDIDLEGTSVTTTEGVDGGLVDIEIEGDTLVNLADKNTVATSNGAIYNGEAIILKPSTLYSQFSVLNTGIFNRLNTTYTVRIEVLKNTSTVDFRIVNYGNVTIEGWSDISSNFVGEKIFKITTGSEFKYNRWIWVENPVIGEGEMEIRLTILEGDWTDKEIPPYFEGIKSVGQDDENGHNIEITSTNSDNTLSNKKEILLNEPLRGLPDGVKDKFVKKDGKWYIERNCAEVTLDGSDDEGWSRQIELETDEIERYWISQINYGESLGIKANTPSYNNMFINGVRNETCMYIHNAVNRIDLRRLKTDTRWTDLSSLREWLSKNPVTVVYQLETPIYEPLEIEPILNTYSDITHISNSSIIPANIKVKNTGYDCILKPNTEYTIAVDTDKSGTIGMNLGGAKGETSNNVLTLTTPEILTDNSLRLYGEGIKASNVRVLEGDVSNSITLYFEGMQSSFENNIQDDGSYEMEILSNNKNILDVNGELLQYDWTYPIRVEQNSDYTISYTGEDGVSYIRFFDSNQKKLPYNEAIWNGRKFNTGNDIFYISIHYPKNKHNFQIEKGSATSYRAYQSNKTQISLSEPLRSVGDVKDRIIKRNGQWVVERNCGEVIFDGSNDENWFIPAAQTDGNSILFRCKDRTDNKRVNGLYYPNLITDKLTILTPREAFGWDGNGNLEGISTGTEYLDGFDIRINKSRLNSLDVNGFKKWLSNNNIKIIYELDKPIYEPLSMNLSLQLFEETTHISNSSTIPANMKVTIDRTINRATEAIELFKVSPTTENLSRARMWVNLLDESIKKDELQGEINSITNLEDMILERKSATANLDVYVMCENMLSMSLNTNNITFDNYSGVEDMEKPNALEISINSSLPYDLNAYLQTEIKGSENSNVMDMDILKIKDSSKDSYQSFSNITDKVILNEDCASGNYISHNIDLKLESSNAYSVDVYKTTIKFEAVQK